MTKLKVGVAGLGHGETLIGANNTELPLEVSSICDVNEDLVQSTMTKHKILKGTSNYDELVSDPDIDIVGIYTPGPLHFKQILKALDNGKHVMVTKSMVYTLYEAEEVIKAVEKSGKILLVTQTMRGRFDFMEAKRVCEDGTIGDLFMAEAHYVHDLRPVYARSPWRIDMPQDLLLGGACHPIDLLRWFMGDIAEVHCYGLKSGISQDYPKEDTFVINTKFVTGKIGRIANYLGVIHPSGVPMNSLSVYGTKGTIIDNKLTLGEDEWLPERSRTTHFPPATGHPGEMLIMLRHMADCVIDGAKPWVGVREGAKVVSTALSCWESMKVNNSVKVRNEF